uniref:Tyrosinase copper-binding domain-containing protein n=1 Tax=Panagrolaimus davidi TaxID=227884 RepID=A0A914P8B0_9BILA
MEKIYVHDILAYTALELRKKCPIPLNYVALEFFHANVHFFVGGDMKPPETAGNDPTFYLLHSFVDYIWEMWRQKRQTRERREREYTENFAECGHPLHFGNETMHPFEILLNRDGLSNAYTDEMYEYSIRPNCSHENVEGCKSKYLFCDTRFEKAKCVPKVKMNGNCTGFEEFDICFEGECSNGKCIPQDSNRSEIENILLQDQNFTTSIIPVTQNLE